jgi:hypothetical protein
MGGNLCPCQRPSAQIMFVRVRLPGSRRCSGCGQLTRTAIRVRPGSQVA